jgi:sugar (pentulose or hexulose) kinase
MDPAPSALYESAGHWPNPVATALRWRWLLRNRPEVVRGAATVLSLSDWIAYRLCGERMTEPSMASETLLLDVGTRRWSPAALERFEVPRAVLPDLAEAGTAGMPLRHSGCLAASRWRSVEATRSAARSARARARRAMPPPSAARPCRCRW